MKQIAIGFFIGITCSAVFFILKNTFEAKAEIAIQPEMTQNVSLKSSRRPTPPSKGSQFNQPIPSKIGNIISFSDNFQLAASIQNMSVEEIDEYLQSQEFSQTFFNGRLKSDFIDALFTRYANLAPEKALTFLQSTKNPVRTQAAYTLFYQWALNDPGAAQSILNSLKDNPLEKSAVRGVVSGVSRLDPNWGLKVSEQYAEGKQDLTALWYLAEDNPELALNHPSLEKKYGRYTRGRILNRWLIENPSEAQQWLAENAQDMSKRELNHLKGRFRNHDPELLNQLNEILPQPESD